MSATGKDSAVQYTTEKELRAQVAEMVSRYPRARELYDASCCGGCFAMAMHDEYGDGAYSAADGYISLLFLLGEEAKR